MLLHLIHALYIDEHIPGLDRVLVMNGTLFLVDNPINIDLFQSL